MGSGIVRWLKFACLYISLQFVSSIGFQWKLSTRMGTLSTRLETFSPGLKPFHLV